MPNPRDWRVEDDDWKLPENWKEIILEGLRDRIDRFRSLQLFMDICVRCGACADKCHFFIGSGDPKNMPVLRAELLRSVYRNNFTLAGKLMGKMVGARDLTEQVLKRMVVLFLSMHRMPTLLPLLPLRHRHGRNHHPGPRTAQSAGAQHRLDRGRRGQVSQGGKPHRDGAPVIQGIDRFFV